MSRDFGTMNRSFLKVIVTKKAIITKWPFYDIFVKITKQETLDVYCSRKRVMKHSM